MSDRPDPDTRRTEDRLRRALADRAARVEPDPRAFTRIEEEVMSRSRLTQSQRWILGGVAAAAGLLIVVVLVLAGSEDDAPVAAGSSTTITTVTTSSTTAPDEVTTPPFSSPVDAFAVAFPSPDSSRRFDTPGSAARAYATDILGFTDLVLGELPSNGGDDAEVEISDREGGPVTTITTERMDDDTWFVTGSRTADIVVDSPAAGASLATPFETTGRALAFEGTVDVVVRTQGSDAEIGSGFVMGSGVPPAGPFSNRIHYAPPDEAVPGVLIYRTLSAEDGRVQQATSFPVRLTSEISPLTPEPCENPADGEAADPDARIVKVYFHCDVDFDEPIALRRVIPADDPAILQRTLEALLAGPTDDEREAGFTSVFPVEGGTLGRVVIQDGVATIDLSDEYRTALPNASATILALHAEVFRTATQFSSVAAVEVLFGGSCEAFAEWSQSDTCLITG